MRIGIMGAMPQEIDLIGAEFDTQSIERIANRTYHVGSFGGVDAVLVFSRWGKVAAASTATTLIERFGVDCILFTGVAGGVAPHVNVGDIVIANRLLQHDFDASATAMFAKFEIPLLGIAHFPVPPLFVEHAERAATEFLSGFDLKHTTIKQIPKIYTGTIASGDQFIADPAKLRELLSTIPDLLCVEMEGAALAQVCHEYRIPYLVIRTISDRADHEAPMDFLVFVQEVARHYSHGILQLLLPVLAAHHAKAQGA